MSMNRAMPPSAPDEPADPAQFNESVHPGDAPIGWDLVQLGKRFRRHAVHVLGIEAFLTWLGTSRFAKRSPNGAPCRLDEDEAPVAGMPDLRTEYGLLPLESDEDDESPYGGTDGTELRDAAAPEAGMPDLLTEYGLLPVETHPGPAQGSQPGAEPEQGADLDAVEVRRRRRTDG